MPRRSEKVKRLLAEGNGSDLRERTIQLWENLQGSKQLSKVWVKVKERDPNREWIAQEIRRKKLKGVNDEDSLQRLEDSVAALCDVTDFVYSMTDLKDVAYNANSAEDEEKLEMIWNSATNNRARAGGRKSPEWNIIGFQGRDPTTDFRGGGVLSLEQLLYVTKERTERVRIQLQEPANTNLRYPWACVGINITSHATKFLLDRLLDHQLLCQPSEEQRRIFNKFYADLFEFFHKDWLSSNAASLMDFPQVFEASMQKARNHLLTNTGLLPT